MERKTDTYPNNIFKHIRRFVQREDGWTDPGFLERKLPVLQLATPAADFIA